MLKTIEISRAQVLAEATTKAANEAPASPAAATTSSGVECNEVSMDESDMVLTDDSIMLNDSQPQ